MLFNSLAFLVFYPIVLILYFLIPGLRARNLLLLAASYFFYMFYRPEYALLMLASTLVDYYAAIGMERHDRPAYRRFFLGMSLFGNLGMLFFFKYFNFFNENLGSLAQLVGIPYAPAHLDLLLPVGISFYTFQTLSYTIDVYRRDMKAEHDFWQFALYVSFFPQLVAGPIERSTNLLPQFRDVKAFQVERAVSGLRIMLWGFFKKVVIADRLAVVVNTIYAEPEKWSGIYLIIGTLAFAFQIYCDFSGYSDIAIGGARIMGFSLMKNFDRPYHAKSVTEFWRRWHISLSTWFRDYLYFPLGGNRKGYARTSFNLFVIFLVSGLWHGARWTFVIWGALNGLAMVFERVVGIGRTDGGKHLHVSPALGVGLPASGVGSPASGVGLPASGVGSPASKVGSPASGVGLPALGSGSGMSEGHEDSLGEPVTVGTPKPAGWRRFVSKATSHVIGFAATAATFSFICFAWIFFRAKDVPQAFTVISRLTTGWETFNLQALLNKNVILGLDYLEFFIAAGALLVLGLVQFLQRFGSVGTMVRRLPQWVRLAVYGVSLMTVIWFAWTESQTFIYFAF